MVISDVKVCLNSVTGGCNCYHIPRSSNMVGHLLAITSLHSANDCFGLDVIPKFIVQAVKTDLVS